MHEPLPRDFRTNDAPTGAPGLVWACTLAVIVAVGCVAIASIAGELAMHSAAASTGDLFSNMPLP